jgi:FeS assembly SUF system protein
MSKTQKLRDYIIAMIKTCYDPEIPVNIWDLGLIYAVKINNKNEVDIVMTLTSPNCPVIDILPLQVEEMVRCVHGVSDVNVELTWEPAWNENLMSDEAKLELGIL